MTADRKKKHARRITRHRPKGEAYPIVEIHHDEHCVCVYTSLTEGFPPLKMVAPGLVGQDQLLWVINNWGLPDDDGVVNIDDLLDVITHWGLPIETEPGLTTNCQYGTGAFGGYNVLSGTERRIIGGSVSGVERAVSMENNQAVDVLRIHNFKSQSLNYGGYGSPDELDVDDWEIVVDEGPDNYGYRGVVKKVAGKKWRITNGGHNKAALRLTGTTSGSLELDTHGGHIWLGGGPADGSNPLGFSGVPINLVQDFSAGNPNQSAMQLFKGNIPMLVGKWTIPQGKMVGTIWNGVASITVKGSVNGTTLTQANKTQYFDGAPGASNVTVVVA